MDEAEDPNLFDWFEANRDAGALYNPDTDKEQLEMEQESIYAGSESNPVHVSDNKLSAEVELEKVQLEAIKLTARELAAVKDNELKEMSDRNALKRAINKWVSRSEMFAELVLSPKDWDILEEIAKFLEARAVNHTMPIDLQAFVTEWKGKPIHAIVEQVRDGTTLRVHLLMPDGKHQMPDPGKHNKQSFLALTERYYSTIAACSQSERIHPLSRDYVRARFQRTENATPYEHM
ncbi:hypothetical protein B0H34DRAFT_799162 [Crassisporium funariophilum]|nr:hypothetical protein B0H34DRAFT_799162 [Crassisporium funariophilum]